MQLTKKQKSIISNHVFEIRFKPNPAILDNRGKWAKLISNNLNYPDWEITENKIKFINTLNNEEAFLSYKNAGYKINNASDIEVYKKRTREFLEIIISPDLMGDSIHIERIGIRSIYSYRYQGEFKTLKDLFEKNFSGLTRSAKEILKVNVADIGVIFDLSDEHGNFRINSGPMSEKQLKEVFQNTENIHKVGLFFDIDYWRKPNKLLTKDEVIEVFILLSNATKKRFDQVCNITLGVKNE